MPRLFARRRRDADFARQLDELERVLTERLDVALAELAIARRYITSSGLSEPYYIYAAQQRREHREDR
jgi:hypothetical protein